MNPILTLRLTLTLIALIALIWGIRTDNSTARLVAIGCLIIALVLRFVKPRPPQ